MVEAMNRKKHPTGCFFVREHPDKLGFIGEIGLRTFLSVAKEKYQKNRHVRKGPRSFPYGSYPLSGAAFLPGAKRLNAL